MKKLSNFAWLLAAMLSATTLTACGDNNNDLHQENISSANVSESLTQVFTGGMPKSVGGYSIARNA